MKKIITLLLSALMLFTVSACVGEPVDNANTTVPEDTDVTLEILKQQGNQKVFGVGTELDPHFFSENVGLKGTTDDGEEWECKAEDWEIFEERMEEMKLKRIRCMLLPSWYVLSEDGIRYNDYNWESENMKSFYRVLDTAQRLGMTVNVTMWGADVSFIGDPECHEWVKPPRAGQEGNFVKCFADCIKYLIETKGYTCVKEITLYNEPNSLYSSAAGNDAYCDLCKLLHEEFLNQDIRDKVLFNLSDDAESFTWLARTLNSLKDIIDVVNSHTYALGDKCGADGEYGMRMSNQQMQQKLSKWPEYRKGYESIPHMWGEFGTSNGGGSHSCYDRLLPHRGLDIPRIFLNFMHCGSVGASYWVLFSQYYGRNDFSTGNIMQMGLWGFADEGYACRPVYYSYSMITRFVEADDVIFLPQSNDDNIISVAFKRNDGKWSYLVINNGETDKKVSFLNRDAYPTELARYVYDENDVPTDNKVIGASGSVTADGRVLTDTVKAGTFVVYTDK